MLSITTWLSDWNASPVVDDAQFRFVPPKGTEKIRFLAVQPARAGTGK
jgi:hypothetical protein